MVHDHTDVIDGPASLDQIAVRFDEQRLVSDAGLLLTGSLAGRLGIEGLVNDSVWLDPRAPGAALPGRKVMSLVHGMLAGADSIDDVNVLRAGSTGLVLGHVVMAPSTLGTFLRAFTFGHVRQLDHVLDESLGRAWAQGAGPGDQRLVIDIDSFVGLCRGRDYAEDRQRCCRRSRRRGRSRSRGRTACRHSFGRLTMGVLFRPLRRLRSCGRSSWVGVRGSHMGRRDRRVTGGADR